MSTFSRVATSAPKLSPVLLSPECHSQVLWRKYGQNAQAAAIKKCWRILKTLGGSSMRFLRYLRRVSEEGAEIHNRIVYEREQHFARFGYYIRGIH